MRTTSCLALSVLFALSACRGGDDDGDGGGGGTPDGGGTVEDATIFDIQNDSMPTGTAVTVRGVVVTAIDNYGERKGGIYVQEPDGGAFSGVYVYLSGVEAADLEVGNLVDLEGFVKDEFAWQSGGESCSGEEDEGTLTELSPAEGGTIKVTVVGDGTVPTPPVVDPWTLVDAAEAEKWEGTPVTFENVRVQTAPYVVDDDNEAQPLEEMRVTGPVLISSSLTDLDAVQDDCYASITGIGDFFFDYKFLPRSAADMVTGGTCLPVENTAELCAGGTDDDYNGFADCADRACQDAVEACTLDASVAQIQGGDIDDNMRVRLTDVVVTGRSYNNLRFWVQDDAATAAPETGIFVFRPSSADDLPITVDVGATLTIEALVDDYRAGCDNGLTQLSFAELGTAVPGGLGPSPITGVGLDVLGDDVNGEPYEGSLVTIENVTVMSIDENETFNLEFTVSDGSGTIVVDDDIYRYTDVEMSECLNITGIIHYNTYDSSDEGGLPPHITILPRSAGEVVTSTGC